MFDPNNIGFNFGGPGMSQNPWHWFRENKGNPHFLLECAYDLYYRRLSYELFDDEENITLNFLKIPWYCRYNADAVFCNSNIRISPTPTCGGLRATSSGTFWIAIPDYIPEIPRYISKSKITSNITLNLIIESIEKYKKECFKSCQSVLICNLPNVYK